MAIKQSLELQKGRTEDKSFKYKNVHYCPYLLSDTLKHVPEQANFEFI